MPSDRAERVLRWLTDDCLPLWAGAGVDPAGGFVERLRLDGTPDYDAPKRMRVQARQIYVFSHAALLGLAPRGLDLALRGYAFLGGSARLSDGGFAHVLSRDGTIIDSNRESYDQAFLLLAFAWLYRASGDSTVRASIDELVSALDRHLRDPNKGYFEDDRRRLPRWQNPHMHLLEAFLACYDATKDLGFLDRARHIVDMFRNHFFEREHGVLREYFTNEWTPAPGEEGDIAEPGHQCEWVWLLWRFGALTKGQMLLEADRLYAHAEAFGKEQSSGLLIDYVSVAGEPRQRTKRCWPQTEALKAALVMSQLRGVPDERAEHVVALLFEHYLDRFVRGAWNDVLDEANRPIATSIPASTLYHVFLAFTEYLSARGMISKVSD